MVGGWEEGAGGSFPKGPSFQFSLFREWGTHSPCHCTHCPQTVGVLPAARHAGPGTLLECEFLIVPRVGQSAEEGVAGRGGSGGDGGRPPGPSPGETGGDR